MKYKLIKTYPGSPELGSIALPYGSFNTDAAHYVVPHPKCENADLAISKSYVEENTEYWEKVEDNIWWCVSPRDYQTGDTLFKEWIIYKIESYGPDSLSRINYFKTKEQAEEFILFNKPCLSYSDIMWNFEERPKKNDVCINIDKLIEFIKSRI
jgi:hypothetical protein